MNTDRKDELVPENAKPLADIAQVLTEAAQRADSTARRRGVRLLFDYAGPAPRLPESGDRSVVRALRVIADYMLVWCLRACSSGTACFSVAVQASTPGRCMLHLEAANVDIGLRDVIGHSPDLSGHPLNRKGHLSSLTLAANVCRRHAGRFDVAALQGGGWLARASLRLDCGAPLPAAPAAPSFAVHAWLVGQPPSSLEATARRVSRQGWIVSLFSSAADALRDADALPVGAGPALVLAAEPLGVRREDIVALRRALPRASRVVWLVDAEDCHDGPPQGSIERCVMPPGEAQLADLAAHCRHLAPPARRSSAHDGRARVLVVDDNDIDRELAAEMLQALGYQVITACDGIEGVDQCLTTRPDLVLTDLEMPHMDGFDVARKVRQLQRDGVVERFPIVATTASVGRHAQAACTWAGMDAVLEKPVDLQLLDTRLSEVIREYAMLDP